MQAHARLAHRKGVVVAEAVAAPDPPVGMAQVVLQQVAVGVVIDEVLVDIHQIIGPQQVAHLLVVTCRRAAHPGAVTERQSPVELRDEGRIGLHVADALDPVLERIDRLAARQAVLGDQLVPAHLRVAGIARAPRLLALPVTRIGGQVAVVVGHGCAGVVPPQRAVPSQARFAAEGQGKRRLRRKGHAPGGDAERHALAPHARIAHPSLLKAPGRVVERIARQREGLLHGAQPRTPHRGRHDGQQRQLRPARKAFREMKPRRQGIREDPFDVHVAPRAGIGREAQPPAASHVERRGDLRPDTVVAVGQPHRRQVRRERLVRREDKAAHAARRTRGIALRRNARRTLLRGTQQPQGRRMAPRDGDAVEFDALIVEGLPAPPQAHLREVEIGDPAISILRDLHGAVEERRVGHDHRLRLLPHGEGVVFVVVGLGRRQARQQQQQAQQGFRHRDAACSEYKDKTFPDTSAVRIPVGSAFSDPPRTIRRPARGPTLPGTQTDSSRHAVRLFPVRSPSDRRAGCPRARMRSGSVRCLLRRRDTPKRTFYAELRRKAPSKRFHHVPGRNARNTAAGRAPPPDRRRRYISRSVYPAAATAACSSANEYSRPENSTTATAGSSVT